MKIGFIERDHFFVLIAISRVDLLIDTAQVIGASVLTMGLLAMWRRRRATRVAS